jgi:hypothetical protein
MCSPGSGKPVGIFVKRTCLLDTIDKDVCLDKDKKNIKKKNKNKKKACIYISN